MTAAVVFLVAITLLTLLIAIYLVSARNTFLRQGETLQRQWAHIDGELRRRHDLVAALLATVAGPVPAIVGTEMTQRLTSALQAAQRHQGGGPAARSLVEQTLDGALSDFLPLAENYPQLRAHEPFRLLCTQIVACQQDMAADIGTYNRNVKAYNSRFDRIPSNLMTEGFVKADPLAVTAARPRPHPASAADGHLAPTAWPRQYQQVVHPPDHDYGRPR